MREFKNLTEFSQYLTTVLKQEKLHTTEILENIGQVVEDDSKRKFGVYQAEVGPFNAWSELSDLTKKERVELGFEPNNPLYRSGHLMHTIYHSVEKMTVFIGSDDEIMLVQERGGRSWHARANKEIIIPPRPVLGPAMFQSQKIIAEIIQKGVHSWLFMKSPVKITR